MYYVELDQIDLGSESVTQGLMKSKIIFMWKTFRESCRWHNRHALWLVDTHGGNLILIGAKSQGQMGGGCLTDFIVLV